jgi:hypothetical protein
VQACQNYAVTESAIFQEPTLTPEPIQSMALLRQMVGVASTVALHTHSAEPAQSQLQGPTTVQAHRDAAAAA